MDASAVIAKEAWDRNRKKLNLEEIKISDNRNNYAVYRRLAPPFWWGWEVLHHWGSLRQVRGDWAGMRQEDGGHGGLERSPNRGHHWQQTKLQFPKSTLLWRGLVFTWETIQVEIYINQTTGNFHFCVFLDFSRIFEKTSLLCLGCILIPPSLSNLQTSRFVMITVISRNNHHQCQVVHHHHYLHSAKTKKGFQSRLQKSQLSSWAAILAVGQKRPILVKMMKVMPWLWFENCWIKMIIALKNCSFVRQLNILPSVVHIIKFMLLINIWGDILITTLSSDPDCIMTKVSGTSIGLQSSNS